MGVEHRVEDEPARDARDAALSPAGYTSVRTTQVGADERVGEVPPQARGARVAVRLEHRDDPAASRPRARRAIVAWTSLGQVRVVVDERDAVDARRGTGSGGRRRRSRASARATASNGDAELERHRRRARRVRALCRPGTGSPIAPSSLAVAREREPAAVAPALVVDDPVVGVVGAAVGARSRAGPRRARPRPGRRRTRRTRPGHRVDEALERGDERVERAVVVEVVGLDVGDDRGFGRELEERAVALVGLDDEPLAVVVRGVRADLVEVAADEEARAASPRRAGSSASIDDVVVLPWLPATAIPRRVATSAREHLGAPEHRDAALAGRASTSGLRRRDRGRHDDRVGVRRARSRAAWPTRASTPSSRSRVERGELA